MREKNESAERERNNCCVLFFFCEKLKYKMYYSPTLSTPPYYRAPLDLSTTIYIMRPSCTSHNNHHITTQTQSIWTISKHPKIHFLSTPHTQTTNATDQPWNPTVVPQNLPSHFSLISHHKALGDQGPVRVFICSRLLLALWTQIRVCICTKMF